MVTRVPIYLGGTGESTQASAQAALGLHSSNSVAFTAVTIGAVNVLANDLATYNAALANDLTTFNSAKANDLTTYNAALANDLTTFNIAKANDYATFTTLTANDLTTYNAALANDLTTFNSAKANDLTTYNAALANDLTTFNIAKANDFATYNAALANDLTTYNTVKGTVDTVQSNLTALISGVTQITADKTFTRDVVIVGNLFVLGDSITANVSNIVTEDKSIVVSWNSTDLLAEGAGLSVAGTSNALIANISFAAASVSKFRIGVGTLTSADDVARVRDFQANDYATFTTLTANDLTTYNAALANDLTTFNSAKANDLTTYNAALANDLTTFNIAKANDFATYNAALANDLTTFNIAKANDLTTYNAALANDLTTFNAAKANDYATYYAVLTNPLLYRIDTSVEGGEIAFARAVDNTSAWSIDVYGTLANTSLRFLDTAKATERMRIDTSGNVGIGTGTPTATLDVVGTFSDAKANTVQQTLTDAATIAWDASLGRVATVTLGASRAFGAPTNLKVGTYILHVIQGGTGSYTITWNGVFKWTAATAPTLSTAVGRRDIFSFISDGTNLYGAMIPDVR